MQAIVFATVPLAIYSTLFMIFSQVMGSHTHIICNAYLSNTTGCLQINHHALELHGNDRRWYRHQVRSGNERAILSTNFAIIQAITSHNVAPASSFAFWASGGLNLQIEHHLLPGVNHWHLRQLQPAIQAAAAKHGVPYLCSDSFSEALARLWHLYRELAKVPQDGLIGGTLNSYYSLLVSSLSPDPPRN
jgi:fatty acid desaturase